MTPRSLARPLPRLPPILHARTTYAMSNCSKAPRGLSVLLWVIGIFTDNANSPRPSPRQCPDRCAIRAGRNLPDKEFRYLRTVIVTAAIHQGFGHPLARTALTFWHWAGVSPYTSPYGLAEACVFGKQSPGRFCCGWHPEGYHQALSRSYGCCFAEFLREGSLDHLGLLDPGTCVGLRYGHQQYFARSFSRQFGLSELAFLRRGVLFIASRVKTKQRICQLPLATCLNEYNQILAQTTVLRPSARANALLVVQEYQPVIHRLRHPASP